MQVIDPIDPSDWAAINNLAKYQLDDLIESISPVEYDKVPDTVYGSIIAVAEMLMKGYITPSHIHFYTSRKYEER